MIDWWMNLEPSTLRTFVAIGALSSLILFIQLIVVLIGGAMDVPDMDLDVGEGGATGMFSVRGIGAFFTGFGWTGAAVLDAGGSNTLALTAAVGVGVLVLVVFVMLMRWLHSLREEGTIDYANAIGQIGAVYVPIPPKRQGLGQIEVLVQDRVSTVRAITDHEEKLGNHTAVRVIDIVDERTLLVEILSEDNDKSNK